MSDIVFGIALIVMAAVSVHFAGSIKAPMLPMQWGLNGKPTWYAPRLLALWFSFGLAVLVRLLIFFLQEYNPDKLSSASLGLILFSVIITIAHIAHMAAAARWAARQ